MPEFTATKPPYDGEGYVGITIDTDYQMVLIEDYDDDTGELKSVFLHFSTFDWIAQQIGIATNVHYQPLMPELNGDCNGF